MRHGEETRALALNIAEAAMRLRINQGSAGRFAADGPMEGSGKMERPAGIEPATFSLGS